MLAPGSTFIALSSGPICGYINDCATCHEDNYGGYTVDLIEEEVTAYTYDARGCVVQVSNAGRSNNGVVSNYRFDKADNRTRVVVTGAP